MRKSGLLIALCLSFVLANAQTSNAERKRIKASKITEAPRIDGVLDDEIWLKASIAEDFYQMRPYNGNAPSQKTEVRVLYDNEAI